MLSQIAIISLPVMAILMLGGGIMGFKKAQSKASLRSGIISFIIYAVAFVYSFTDVHKAFALGLGISVGLCIAFTVRTIKTKKMMPSGLLLILALAETVLVFFARSST